MVFALLLRYAYVKHDTVTGTMILEEMLEAARIEENQDHGVLFFEESGEALGNPRLWLGEYNLEVEIGTRKVSGCAEAGDWKKDMEISCFRPGEFMRKMDCINEIKEKLEDNGSE